MDALVVIAIGVSLVASVVMGQKEISLALSTGLAARLGDSTKKE